MMSKAYPKYKPSGVEWLGDVPEHWGVKRTGILFKIKKEIAGIDGIDVLSITQKGIKVKDTESNDGQLSMDYSKYQLVDTGDFAMNHMDLLTGFVDIAQHSGVTSPDYRVFKERDKRKTESRYYLQIFQLCYYLKIYYDLGQGVSGFGRWRLPREQFLNFRVPLPPLPEQQAIAAFLDRETGRIDSLIAKKQRLLQLLAEQRTALISRAVTKGLDASVKLKPSGVEWLGDVPEHWGVKKLKHMAYLKSGDGITIEEIEDEGEFPVFGGNGFRGFANKYTHDGEYVLIGRQGALCGNINYANGKFWASEHAVVANPSQPIATFWLGELLRIMNLNQYSVSAAQPGLAIDRIKELFLPVPPLLEQQAIAAFLDRETAKIDTLSARVVTVIEQLKEYRTALISSAVTGKIDVREAV